MLLADTCAKESLTAACLSGARRIIAGVLPEVHEHALGGGGEGGRREGEVSQTGAKADIVLIRGTYV